MTKNEAKYIQSLHHKKFRQQHDRFIAEGPKVVEELISRRPEWLQQLYGTKEWWNAITPQKQQLLQPFFTEIQSFDLEKISALQTPQQVLAVASLPPFTYQQKADWLLVLDGIQDPGNLGTIIRTAHWFGIQQVVCSRDCADVFSPKVVQAAMGSSFAVNVVYEDLVPFFSGYHQPVYGALLHGKNISVFIEKEPGCIIIGNEGKGIRPELMSFITHKLTIPGAGDAESLNAAVAAGILMNWACGE